MAKLIESLAVDEAWRWGLRHHLMLRGNFLRDFCPFSPNGSVKTWDTRKMKRAQFLEPESAKHSIELIQCFILHHSFFYVFFCVVSLIKTSQEKVGNIIAEEIVIKTLLPPLLEELSIWCRSVFSLSINLLFFFFRVLMIRGEVLTWMLLLNGWLKIVGVAISW